MTVPHSDGLSKETVTAPGPFGVRCSVAAVSREELKNITSRCDDESTVMVPAHSLNLDMYEVFRGGRLAPGIFFAGQTVFYGLLLSRFVADPKYTYGCAENRLDTCRLELDQQVRVAGSGT